MPDVRRERPASALDWLEFVGSRRVLLSGVLELEVDQWRVQARTWLGQASGQVRLSLAQALAGIRDWRRAGLFGCARWPLRWWLHGIVAGQVHVRRHCGGFRPQEGVDDLGEPFWQSGPEEEGRMGRGRPSATPMISCSVRLRGWSGRWRFTWCWKVSPMVRRKPSVTSSRGHRVSRYADGDDRGWALVVA
jgi:hypothetical protein